jgi:hypothetical protein
MGRRVGAILGMAIVIALAFVLVWEVHLHHAYAPNAHDLNTVSVTAGENITRRSS